MKAVIKPTVRKIMVGNTIYMDTGLQVRKLSFQ